jgi:hypothetical protein
LSLEDRVQGLGFGVETLGCRVKDSGFKGSVFYGLGFRVYDLECRVWRLGFKVQELGFRV